MEWSIKTNVVCLEGPDLSGVTSLIVTKFGWAKYNAGTKWPEDFDPAAKGRRLL